jgi:hypothetical protein
MYISQASAFQAEGMERASFGAGEYLAHAKHSKETRRLEQSEWESLEAELP